MTIRRILLYPADERLLRKKSERLRGVDRQTRELIGDLKETLAEAGGAGLAAPQIGAFMRVVVVRFGQDAGEMQPARALVNPEIVSQGPPTDGFDGCLSLPGLVTWKTPRPAWLVFRALDERGKAFQMEVTGIDARLLHHECDHLDGTLFIDRVSSLADIFTPVETDDGERLVSLAAAL